uniref:Reverse transcriptase domain-containing protein n=1 Tax=Triticum urartu TaxID=4572 RepID=A0A8R7QM82_TRIUA
MLIDWPSRRMQIEHEGFTMVLQGVISNASKCETLNSVQLASMEKQAAVAYAIHICFATDSDTITELNCTELPPEIVQGAQPVNIRGYRHKPELKMEVERQVAEMLKAALIQKSSIPFSSPIILVKKKDGTWRMCVDYRCLNAMTIISKYPVPVLEDILDELSGACWFSKLDLRSGYHQIRLAEGEEYKTAFQTHSGHY